MRLGRPGPSKCDVRRRWVVRDSGRRQRPPQSRRGISRGRRHLEPRSRRSAVRSGATACPGRRSSPMSRVKPRHGTTNRTLHARRRRRVSDRRQHDARARRPPGGRPAARGTRARQRGRARVSAIDDRGRDAHLFDARGRPPRTRAGAYASRLRSARARVAHRRPGARIRFPTGASRRLPTSRGVARSKRAVLLAGLARALARSVYLVGTAARRFRRRGTKSSARLIGTLPDTGSTANWSMREPASARPRDRSSGRCSES